MSRYPVEANAVGLVQHDNQKLFMFSILWSDCNNILIYRTYDCFKDFSKSLAKKFPLEAGVVHKAERILPVLKALEFRSEDGDLDRPDISHGSEFVTILSSLDKTLRTRYTCTSLQCSSADVPLLFRGKFSNRYLERLRLLEMYSKQILQTDSKISQCEDVVQFFSPNKQDLTPSFPQNSIVIMPSDNDQKQKEATCPPRSTQPPTTQPIISEAYICIEAFETKDTKNRSFKVQKDQHIDVLIKDPSGWWLVENEEKHLAWFPAPYLKKSESLADDTSRRSLNKGMYYYAEKGYEAQHTDEISLSVGVVVEVIEKSEIGWWLICYNSRFGYVPSMFLKPYENPHHKLQVTLDHKLSGSSPNLSKIISNLDAGADLQPQIPVRIHKGNLQKMKSISLSGLDDLSDSPDQVFVTPSRNTYMDWGMQDAEGLAPLSMTGKPRSVQTVVSIHDWKDHLERADHGEEEKERKDSGFEERVSPKTSVSSDSADSIAPPVPQRPTLQEIQSRCTTMTMKAALQGNV